MTKSTHRKNRGFFGQIRIADTLESSRKAASFSSSSMSNSPIRFSPFIALVFAVALLSPASALISGCKSGSETSPGGSESPKKESSKVIKTKDLTQPEKNPEETLAVNTEGLPQARDVDIEKLGRMPHLKVVLESLYKVQKRYVDPQKVDARKMFVQGLQEVQENTAAVQIRFFPEDVKRPELGVVQVGKSLLPFSLAHLKDVDDTYTYFRWILGFITSKLEATGDFSEKDKAEIEYAAINGFLGYLDPYSVLLPPETFGEMKIRTSGSFGGIGIVISIRKGALTVISPIDGTPAAKAGIEPSDKIVRIEAESTVNMSLHEAVSRLRGQVGTKVTFWVERDGLPEPKKYTLTRDRIEIHSVSSKVLEGDVGYLRLSRFSENTMPELKENIKKLTDKGVKSIILDVANNPGGLLSQAVAVADAFLDSGIIVTTEGAGGVTLETTKAKKSTTLWRGPLVVLINRGCASAGEIVAGSLKHLDRALVFGDRSFGKGTVQVLMKNSDDSALKLTVAEYLVRGDVQIQTLGIVPDILTLPIVFREKWVRFHRLHSETGEEHLPKHLSSHKKGKMRKPSWSLRYLQQERNKTKEKNRAEAETGADPRLQQMARDFLIKYRGTREEMMKDAEVFVKKERLELEKQIVQTFKKVGVDWSAPPDDKQTEDYKLSVKLKTDKPDNTVQAGDELEITMAIQNNGTSPVYRIRGMVKASPYFIDEKEFVMGRIDPGKQKSWSTVIKIPSHQRTQVQPLTAKLFSDDNPLTVYDGPTEDSPFLLKIVGLKRPELKIVYQFQKKGGKGLLKPGDTVNVKGTLENIGEGEAENAIVTLRNISGKWVYLVKGREVIEKLKPGQKKPFALSFKLQENGFEKNLKLELGAYESEIRIGFERKLAFNLDKPAEEFSGILQAPIITLEDPSYVTDSRSVDLSGKITHPQKLLDMYIFVGNEKNLSYRKKVHYQTINSPDSKEMKFNTRVKLPVGLNTIVVLARSSKKLTTYRLFKVLRKKGSEEVQETARENLAEPEVPTPASSEENVQKTQESGTK